MATRCKSLVKKNNLEELHVAGFCKNCLYQDFAKIKMVELTPELLGLDFVAQDVGAILVHLVQDLPGQSGPFGEDLAAAVLLQVGGFVRRHLLVRFTCSSRHHYLFRSLVFGDRLAHEWVRIGPPPIFIKDRGLITAWTTNNTPYRRFTIAVK
jgi:hypothetical protein